MEETKTKSMKSIFDYVEEGMKLMESGTLYIDMKRYASDWMRYAQKYEDMMLILYSVLTGMINEIKTRDIQYMRPNEIKQNQRMLEFLETLMEMVEKNK
jgi:hypothetical protein